MKAKIKMLFSVLTSLSLLLPAFCSAFDNSAAKVIALTFDDGPNKQNTEKVLTILEQNNIKATFFVVGGSVKKNPEILKKVFAAGNAIGNHSYTHPNFSTLSNAAMAKELTKTNEQIYQVIHVYPTLFRPPFGTCSSACSSVVTSLGLKKITWDYMVNDWDVNKTSAEKIATNVIKHAKPGAIITMHDGGGNREKTVMALPLIISTLKHAGYHFVTIPELLNIKGVKS